MNFIKKFFNRNFPKVLIDDTFGVMEYNDFSVDDYLGNHYSFTKEITQLNKNFHIRVECKEGGPSNKQKALFKIITENFTQLEEKMYDSFINKTGLSTTLSGFRKCFNYPAIIIFKDINIKETWFIAIEPPSFDISHLGFTFKDFDVIEVVVLDNEGKEL